MLLKTIVILLSLLALPNALAQERASNILYTQATTLYISGALSLNYERILHHHYSIRAGFSRGYRGDAEYFIFPLKMDFSNAASLTAFYLTGSFEDKFELGGGVASVLQTNTFAPVVAIGYRYQPYKSGLFYRAGFEYAHFYGLQLSAGYCF